MLRYLSLDNIIFSKLAGQIIHIFASDGGNCLYTGSYTRNSLRIISFCLFTVVNLVPWSFFIEGGRGKGKSPGIEVELS